jgi:hypothetical protein
MRGWIYIPESERDPALKSCAWLCARCRLVIMAEPEECALCCAADSNAALHGRGEVSP